MNKEQYRQYRRNQRICHSDEYGWPDNANAEYFELIPYTMPIFPHFEHAPLYKRCKAWNKKCLKNWGATVKHHIKLNIQGGF